MYVRRHLLLYKQLRTQAADAKLWALYPKHHLMIHVGESCLVNPKAEWNYRDESEIGLCAAFHKKANQTHTSLLKNPLLNYRAHFELEPFEHD